MLPVPVADIENFYPRPPRGGRRWVTGKPRRSSFYFYPRPPRGGRLKNVSFLDLERVISIHALREVGDSR